MKELIFRIKAILKRTRTDFDKNSITYRDMKLNLSSRQLYIDNKILELTKLEFDLLYTLINNQNIVLSRDYLLEHVWAGDEFYQERTVNVAINRLKEKIDSSKEKEYIKTVRGVGYTLC
jgi:DNA-binding response OmpR family regulator